ncbi:MAG: YfhO family protein [Atopobiaceae bacterium]|nr:YfhO family protein [Atopobiaceae bacterium]
MAGFLARKEQEFVRRGSCYRAYSVLFIPCALLVFFGLFSSGREIIWNIDGLGQYYPFFIYEGQWIRSIVGSLFSGQGLQVPLWEWCSGYGADIPTTFDVFLDPLNLVSAITPPSLSEWVFQLLVLLRLYLSGLAFVFYCRTRGENKTGTVIGALLYALCGAGLTGVRWSSGLHALMLFPVILAGAERILAHKKPWVFVASLSALAIMSYYFTYMACLLLVGYLVVRVVMVERPHLTVGRFLRWVVIFAGLVILCLVIAGFAIVPAVSALLGMNRLVDQATTVPLLYSPLYYMDFFSGFLSTDEVGSDTYQGFGGLALFGCIALFSQKKKNGELKLVFIVLTAFMLIPQVGSVFNGFNYASNRWAWAYNLCMALILVRSVPELLKADGVLRKRMALGCACYALLFLIPYCRSEANVAGFAAMLCALVLLGTLTQSTRSRLPLLLALCVTLAVNGFYFLSSQEDGIGSSQTPLGMAYPKLTSASNDSPALDVAQDQWWRYDEGWLPKAMVHRIPNNSLVLGLQGIDFYNSVYNDRVDRFHTELAIAGDNINFRYVSLQGRSDLMALLGVRYYVYRNDGTDSLPFGYPVQNVVAQRDVMGLNHQVVEAKNSLPLGIAFDKALMHSDYLSLTPMQRQQALLQSVVLEDDKMGPNDRDRKTEGAEFVSPSSLQFEDSSVPFEVLSSSGVDAQEGRFVVSEPNSSITFSCKGSAQANTYVYLTNLEYENALPSKLVPEEQIKDLPWHYRANLMLQDLSYVEPIDYEISMRGNATTMTGFLPNSLPSNHMYGGKDTWLVNIGYAEQPVTNITVTFDKPGIYTYDNMQVLTQTHAHFDEWMHQRGAATLQNVKQGCNRLTGNIDLEQNQTLLLTVAYSTGWTAYVDGKETPLLCGDTGFMALDLAAGHHDIELRYQTPGIVTGFAVTGAGLIALAVLALVLRRQAA